MRLRGLTWPDVLAILDSPTQIREGGPERFNRPKWILSGMAIDGLPVEFVCVLDLRGADDWAILVTMY